MKGSITFAKESEKLLNLFLFNAERKLMLVSKSKKVVAQFRAGGNNFPKAL